MAYAEITFYCMIVNYDLIIIVDRLHYLATVILCSIKLRNGLNIRILYFSVETYFTS